MTTTDCDTALYTFVANNPVVVVVRAEDRAAAEKRFYQHGFQLTAPLNKKGEPEKLAGETWCSGFPEVVSVEEQAE